MPKLKKSIDHTADKLSVAGHINNPVVRTGSVPQVEGITTQNLADILLVRVFILSPIVCIAKVLIVLAESGLLKDKDTASPVVY